MNPVTHQNPAITLEFVKSKFDHWRATRKCRSKTPDELWEYATQLYPQYNCHKISRALNLAHADLKSRLTLHARAESKKSKSNDFAECLLPASAPVHENKNEKNCIVEFIRKDGVVLKLSDFSPTHLLPVVSLFIAGKS